MLPRYSVRSRFRSAEVSTIRLYPAEKCQKHPVTVLIIFTVSGNVYTLTRFIRLLFLSELQCIGTVLPSVPHFHDNVHYNFALQKHTNGFHLFFRSNQTGTYHTILCHVIGIFITDRQILQRKLCQLSIQAVYPLPFCYGSALPGRLMVSSVMPSSLPLCFSFYDSPQFPLSCIVTSATCSPFSLFGPTGQM